METRRKNNFIFLMSILTAVFLFGSGIRLFIRGDLSGTTIYFLMGIILFTACLDWYQNSQSDGL